MVGLCVDVDVWHSSVELTVVEIGGVVPKDVSFVWNWPMVYRRTEQILRQVNTC